MASSKKWNIGAGGGCTRLAAGTQHLFYHVKRFYTAPGERTAVRSTRSPVFVLAINQRPHNSNPMRVSGDLFFFLTVFIQSMC